MTDGEIEELIVLSQKVISGPWSESGSNVYYQDRGQPYWFAETANQEEAQYFAALSPERVRSLADRLKIAERERDFFRDSGERLANIIGDIQFRANSYLDEDPYAQEAIAYICEPLGLNITLI